MVMNTLLHSDREYVYNWKMYTSHSCVGDGLAFIRHQAIIQTKNILHW